MCQSSLRVQDISDFVGKDEMNTSRIWYSCSYSNPRLSNKLIKLEEISNYTVICKAELSNGPESLVLSLSENALLEWLW